MLDVINKGPERRDRWNRGMTKKELSDMALGVRELSKRLGIKPTFELHHASLPIGMLIGFRRL